MTRVRAALLFVGLLAESASLLSGQLASLVRDLRPTGVGGSSLPGFLGFAGERAFFEAYTPAIGQELWSTDGTPEGTRLVGDRCDGECDSFFTPLAQTNDRLFVAVSTHHSTSSPQEILALGGESPEVEVVFANSSSFLPYFEDTGTTALLGDALIFWTTDFNSTTRLYSAAAPGAELTLLVQLEQSGHLARLHRSGPLVYFWNYPQGFPEELWATDGTPGGTHRITTFEFEGIDAVEVSTGDRNLLFSAAGANGSELWFSDGTAGGTYPLSSFTDPEARIWSLATTSNGANFLVEDASFGQELWTTDGTAGGTRAATSFGFHAPFGEQPAEGTLFAAGGRIYFFASNGIDRVDLWVTSPSGASASTLMQICQEAFCYQDRWLVSVDSQVFFAFADPEHGRELWTTDGTPSGTHLFTDICPDACSGFGEVLASSAGRLAFTAVSGPNEPQTLYLASAPWLTVATLWDPVRGAPTFTTFAERSAIDSGERLYFAAQDPLGGTEPWVSDGSPSSTLQLVDIWGTEESGSEPSGFTKTGNAVAFRAYAGDYGVNESFWLSEGTSATTRQLAGLPSYCIAPYYPLESLPDRLVTLDCWGDFLVLDPAASSLSLIPSGDCLSSMAFGAVGGQAAAALWCPSGTQIWKSDGTVAGTSSTLTLPEGFGIQAGFSAVGSHLLFAGGGDDVRLYSMPGSLDAAVPLTAPGTYFESLIAPENESLGFFAMGTRLHRTDGTPGGTFPVGPPHEYLILRAAIRSAAGYDLLVRNEFNFYEVWKSDGTDSGTQNRGSIGPVYDSTAAVAFDRAGDDLYFILGSYGEPQTLWTLTDSSTQPRALHAAPPAGSSGGPFLAHRGAREFFRGCDASHGCELWVTEASEATTRMLHDIYPGPASSDPAELFTNGDLLYFSADDGLHGRELWVLPLDGGPPCRATESALCLEGGRFQVTSRWTDFARRTGDAAAVPITPDTGYFWFFDEDNVELILKLIDGGGFNGHHWVYYGALSNVEYTFTVTDSETGAAKRYFNPATRFASSGDITAFGPNGAHAAGGPAEAMTRAATPPAVSLAAFTAPQGLPGTCVPSPTRFCILNDRFAVTATWRDFAGHTGVANAGTLTDDTGYLWFFNEANVEVVLKMVDAGAFNQHFWVYYGALSNVEYTLTVTDTLAGGPPRIYRNALGQFGSFGDIEAFPAP